MGPRRVAIDQEVAQEVPSRHSIMGLFEAATNVTGGAYDTGFHMRQTVKEVHTPYARL